MPCDIAIIGLSFRLPGCDRDDALAHILEHGHLDGQSVIRLPPADRWPFHRFAPPPELSAWHEVGPCGLIDNAFDFDPAPFFVSPREAKLLDPQHRMALELAFLAQEDAGYGGDALARQCVGVFIGTTRTDYLDAITEHLGADDFSAPLSNSRAVLANRISSVFDFRGPSLTIDTLCSSSFVALHQACRSLRAGDCDAALAGGVNFLMSPRYFMVLRRLGLMSPTHACRPFSRKADGFVPAEGGAIVCLKRLEDALHDGDSIRAVIKGSGIVHHGQSTGLTVPDPEAIAQAMRRGLADAGLEAKDIGLVQAMGASGVLGDRAELEALRTVFGPGSRDVPVAVSCEKGALGHLEPASGMAGLMAALRALAAGRRYPVHGIGDGATADEAVRFVVRPEEWPDDQRRVGISSLGMTGTHVHVVVEQAPPIPPDEPVATDGWMVFPVAADSPAGLALQASDYAEAAAGLAAAGMRDACFTAATGRRHGRQRAAVVAPDSDGIGRGLRALAAGEASVDGATIIQGATDGGRSPAQTFAPDEPDRARYEAAAHAFVAGNTVDWAGLLGARRRVRLPTTRLNRRTFLYEPPAAVERPSGLPAATTARPAVHPLLRGARKG